ncbi:MAG: hypothetical protein ACPGN3_14425 [Opitutales bacterium]
MQDIMDRIICVGDILALSTRAGKHDSQIKILCVTEIVEEAGDAYSGTHWYIRGYTGAGMLTQVQKSNNLLVISPMIPFDHPRLDNIKRKLKPEELKALKSQTSDPESKS